MKSHLQVAIEIELATIPVYLYSYYSIDRTIAKSKVSTGFPQDPVARYADKAGALIMSVAVEEMLHMSLSSNVLYALGQDPQLYMKSPGPYPTNLPGHAKLGPDDKKLAIPLAPFSEDHLWHFLEIEYPAVVDAPPEGSNWNTIGQIYAYVRSIIFSKHITDADFKGGSQEHQIQPGNYSPNNITTPKSTIPPSRNSRTTTSFSPFSRSLQATRMGSPCPPSPSHRSTPLPRSRSQNSCSHSPLTPSPRRS